MVCKGTCTKYRALKPYNASRYNVGQKRCSICDIFINWDGKNCPCCNFVLRINPRNTHDRKNLGILQQIKRI